MKNKINNSIYFIFFIFTLSISYYLGVAFFDITTGLDFNKYVLNLNFFSGKDLKVYDSQGSLYFWTISNFSGYSDELYNTSNLKTLINNKIQLINLAYYVLGLGGLGLLLKIKEISFKNILLSFSILNFFPTAFYFRLTMKPEIMAFAILPWIFVLFVYYFNHRSSSITSLLVILLSVCLTIKGSITGMILLSLPLLYRKKLLKLKDNLYLFCGTFAFSSLFIYFNFFLTGKFLFGRPTVVDQSLVNRWNNTADLSFFTNIDFTNLYENPFKHLHSDSFVSITLLDTLADYFTFFWKHDQKGNFFQHDKIQFTDNFLIQTFLPDYISIIFTITFYFLIVILYIFGIKDKEFLLLPLCGLSVLIINSLGFPNKNFNPETGDLFKVHYYSFFISISLVFLLNYFYKHFNLSRHLSILLIPIFFITMGFPKDLSEKNLDGVMDKLENTLICSVIDNFNNVVCK
jgi:hypothetical protein